MNDLTKCTKTHFLSSIIAKTSIMQLNHWRDHEIPVTVYTRRNSYEQVVQVTQSTRKCKFSFYIGYM